MHELKTVYNNHCYEKSSNSGFSARMQLTVKNLTLFPWLGLTLELCCYPTPFLAKIYYSDNMYLCSTITIVYYVKKSQFIKKMTHHKLIMNLHCIWRRCRCGCCWYGTSGSADNQTLEQFSNIFRDTLIVNIYLFLLKKQNKI